MINIAIFASGGGSNALKIIEHFAGSETVNVALIVTNKRTAGVVNIAADHEIPVLALDRTFFYDSESLLDILKTYSIDFIALAGFLWLIPEYLVAAFPQKIVNIHPALLPRYGGKGMYGHHVHEAVKAAGESVSGMTIHFVNQQYDEGNIIFQAETTLSPDDTPADIAVKVLALEHQHYPAVIERVLTSH